jgi:hypothetical protein
MIRGALLFLLLSSSAWADATKFFVVIRGIDEAPGVSSGIVPELKKLFTDELAKHPELTLETPAGLPPASDPEALDTELKKRKIKALELTLKVVSVKRNIDLPPPGKPFRVLTRGISLEIFGDAVPEKVLALGGDGGATVQAEINKTADPEKEGKPLLMDAAKEAIRQAVDMTVNKLKIGDEPVKMKSAKKKKKT